jgi:hypothetical protein
VNIAAKQWRVENMSAGKKLNIAKGKTGFLTKEHYVLNVNRIQTRRRLLQWSDLCEQWGGG